MGFPKVSRTGMAVPTGPTGTLSSGSRGAKKAGGKRVGKKSGLQASPAKMPGSMKR